VTLPDIRGREQILNVHMRKVPIGQDVNPSIIARGTPGMSGADLANLCNEAALMAARRNAPAWSRCRTSRRPRTRSSWAPSARAWSCPRKSAATRPTTSPATPHRQAAAQVRPGPQGHHHPARPRAGRDDEPAGAGPLQLRPRVHAEPDQHAVRRPHRRRSVHAPDDHRRQQRLRARHAPGPRHGDALRHDRRAGPDGLRRERRRSVPGPLGHQDHQHERVRPCRRSTPKCAASSTSSTPWRVA
jgi:hypothetical protein